MPLFPTPLAVHATLNQPSWPRNEQCRNLVVGVFARRSHDKSTQPERPEPALSLFHVEALEGDSLFRGYPGSTSFLFFFFLGGGYL